MHLTVLGSSASYAGAGQACSGYLVGSGDERIVLDLGNGALANLGAVCDPLTVSAVFVTHAHPDHYLDVYPLQSLLRYAPSGPAAPLALHVPEGLFERMGRLLDDRGREDLDAAFEVHPLVEGRPVRLGNMTVTPWPVDHVPETFALVVEGDGTRLCYTSDSRLGASVRRAAEGANTLVAEATLPAKYAGRAPHMTAGEAGMLATDVSADRLVLTHLWPTTHRSEIIAEAGITFDGEILLAEELLGIDL